VHGDTCTAVNLRISRASTPPSYEVASLLDALSVRLRRGQSSELYVLCAKLESLRHRLGELTSAERQRLERSAQFLRPALRTLLDRAQDGQLEAPRARRDLRTILCSLRCMSERLDDAEVGPRLSLRYSRADLSQLVRTCCTAFTPIADERKLRFDIEVPARLSVEVEVDKIQAIVANLTFNAFKHTPSNSHVRCVLHHDVAADEIAFSVSDSGPSIPPNRVEALFSRSHFLDRVSVGAQALGLSLGTSRDLAALHGGTLTLQNNDDVGVTFELRLPRHAPAGTRVARRGVLVDDLTARVVELARFEFRAEAELGASGADAGDDRPLLLIVEDTRSLHRVLADCFKSEYRVASAFDGLEGLTAAETMRPDLILTDLIMPRLDGRAMIRAVRQRAVLAGIPIVVLTTKENPEQELELLDHGVQDVIHKPFLLPEVQARVRNLIASKRARDVLSDLVDRHQTDLIHLADTVARQQRELQLALEQVETARSMAEGASRVKSNFLRMMSHELKTPVTAMQLQLRILERDPEFADNPRLQEAMGRIWRSSRKLLYLVDTMLEWARVESGRCRVYAERFDLVALVHDVTDELSSYAEQKRVGLSVRVSGSVEPSVISDRRLVQLILMNLVARALQLTRAGVVEIDIEQCGEGRRVSVRDLAEAASAEDARELFEPVSTTKDLRWTGGPGSGLGLQVVRDIARAIDAEIRLERSDKPGNTLALELPALQLEATSTPPEPLSAGGGGVRAV
jgi:signal transduction histidine kinase